MYFLIVAISGSSKASLTMSSTSNSNSEESKMMSKEQYLQFAMGARFHVKLQPTSFPTNFLPRSSGSARTFSGSSRTWKDVGREGRW